MLKFCAVAIHHMDHAWQALLVCLAHLVWLIQSARLHATVAPGNWNGEPVVYPRLLVLLRRRMTPKRCRANLARYFSPNIVDEF